MYRSNIVGFGNHPAPKVPTGLICFIIAFAVAPLISEDYPFTVGVFLAYVLIKLSQFFKKGGGNVRISTSNAGV